MTEEESEILELRYEVKNLSEQLAFAVAEATKYEQMFEALGARYARLKWSKDNLWNEYCELKVRTED